MLRKTSRLGLLLPLAAALTLAAAAGASPHPKVNASVKIGTAKIGKLGTVLVDGDGHVLYMFQPDKHAKVACNSDCQSIWPAVIAPKTGVAKATGKVKQSKLGSYRNPYDGKRIVTYNGWPLYTYVSDQGPGQANGQNLDLNGGYWWVLTANGKPEK
jgi:predicted lipoprotein with Yx(FWY)xxD motif